MTTTPLTHDEVRTLMLDSIRGALQLEEHSRFDQHLRECPTCREEFEELRSGWEMLGQLPAVRPPRSLRAQTLTVLSAYAQGIHAGSRTSALDAIDHVIQTFWPRRPALQAAIAIVLLVIGIGFGSQITTTSEGSSEVAQLRGEIHAMSRMLAVSFLQQQSASDRLKGVSMSARLDGADDEITAALLEALKFDPNVNVRLAALDALSGRASDGSVRSEMLTSLPRQTSPLVQLAIIDILADDRDATTEKAFASLMKTEKLDPTVKERVRLAMGEVR
jgi:hypothetical protein